MGFCQLIELALVDVECRELSALLPMDIQITVDSLLPSLIPNPPVIPELIRWMSARCHIARLAELSWQSRCKGRSTVDNNSQGGMSHRTHRRFWPTLDGAGTAEIYREERVEIWCL